MKKKYKVDKLEKVGDWWHWRIVGPGDFKVKGKSLKTKSEVEEMLGKALKRYNIKYKIK